MRQFAIGGVKHAIRAFAYGLLGAFLVLLGGAVFYLESQSDLKIWHKAELDAEFAADLSAQVFSDYLALEERLFAQLDERVYARVQPEDRGSVNRYVRGGPEYFRKGFQVFSASPRLCERRNTAIMMTYNLDSDIIP